MSLTQQESNLVWAEIREQKQKGGYPWTHLSHHQDEEVWINPQKLPQDIGRYVYTTRITSMTQPIFKS